MNPDAIPIDEAYRACGWLLTHGESWKSRHLARKLKRLLSRMFRQAVKGAVKEQDKDKAWRLSTLLLLDETLHPSPEELIQKATLQQWINCVSHKIQIASEENLIKEVL